MTLPSCFCRFGYLLDQELVTLNLRDIQTIHEYRIKTYLRAFLASSIRCEGIENLTLNLMNLIQFFLTFSFKKRPIKEDFFTHNLSIPEAAHGETPQIYIPCSEQSVGFSVGDFMHHFL